MNDMAYEGPQILKVNLDRQIKKYPDYNTRQLADQLLSNMDKVFPDYYNFVQVFTSWNDGAWQGAQWKNELPTTFGAWPSHPKYYIMAVAFTKDPAFQKPFDAWGRAPFNWYELLWTKQYISDWRKIWSDKILNESGYRGWNIFWKKDDTALAGCDQSQSKSGTDTVKGYSYSYTRIFCMGGHLYHIEGSKFAANVWY